MMQNSPIRYTWDTREFRVLQYMYACMYAYMYVCL